MVIDFQFSNYDSETTVLDLENYDSQSRKLRFSNQDPAFQQPKSTDSATKSPTIQQPKSPDPATKILQFRNQNPPIQRPKSCPLWPYTCILCTSQPKDKLPPLFAWTLMGYGQQSCDRTYGRFRVDKPEDTFEPIDTVALFQPGFYQSFGSMVLFIF